MKAANRWITYRTRFLVKAKQLNNSLNFTDVLGRQHSGSKGDYLVESSEGVLSIAPRQIFEDIYVPLLTDHGAIEEIAPSPNYLPTPVQQQPVHPRGTSQSAASLQHCGTLTTFPLSPTFVRKTVQAYHDRPASIPSLRSV
jgi:hypothetical protein